MGVASWKHPECLVNNHKAKFKIVTYLNYGSFGTFPLGSLYENFWSKFLDKLYTTVK